MRMVRAGERPSADAAAMRLVVLNGTGGCCLRVRFSTAATVALAAPETAAMAAFAAASSLKRAVECGAVKASSSPAVGPAVAPASKAPLITQ